MIALRAAVIAAGLALAGCQGGDDGALSVVISVPEQNVTGVARATLHVDYSGTGARIVSEGGGPACAFILPGIDGEFADDHQGTLTVRASGARALRGPADIAACRMLPGDPEATAADLREKMLVRVAAAEDAAGKAIDVAAKAGKGAGGPAADRSEKAIEEAQEAAVRAAAIAVPPRAPATAGDASRPAGTTTGTATGNVAGSVASTGGAVAAGTASATRAAAEKAATAAQKPAVARPAAPGNLVRQPGGATGAPDDAGDPSVPVGRDRDPSYDDTDDPSAPAYSIDISVQTASRFGALQVEINHLGSSGSFIGRNDGVDCVSLVEAIVASNYLGERVTKVGLISLAGIRTPAAILRCGFRTREPLSPNSFLVTVADASDTESEPLDPVPTVAVTNVTRR